MHARLEHIWIYPIKGIGGAALPEAAVEPQGLAHDRRWMLVDAEGGFLSQRQVPRLAQLRATVTDGGLLCSAPGAPNLELGRPATGGQTVKVAIWGDVVEAACGGERAEQWFTDVLGRPCRPVYMDASACRRVDPTYDPGGAKVSFADGYPLLLTSTGSLADLNARMGAPLPMNRFRPNVVISGAAPFAEDAWREILIGAVRFLVVKSCARCVVTTINQETMRAGKEPLRTLSRFRKRNSKVYFGENLIPMQPGVIRVGDSVTVLARRTPAERLF